MNLEDILIPFCLFISKNEHLSVNLQNKRIFDLDENQNKA